MSEVPQNHQWLAMLFLGADNDIFVFGDALLREAERVGSTDEVVIVAQQDPPDPAQHSRRGRVVRGGWEFVDIGSTDGDIQAIGAFVRDSTAAYPAQKKILFLWDHGNGWQNVHAFESFGAPARLTVEELMEAVGGGADISILCFDACLMAMLEIAYQLRHHVQYVVASENVVPADSGWPYDAILRRLTTKPEIEPEQVVRAIVEGFSGAYNGSDHPVTLSALNLAKVDDVVAAVDRLARELIAACLNGDRQKVLMARRYSQSFGNPDYIDLFSFCKELQRLLPGTRIDRAAKEVRERVEQMVVGVTRGSAASISDAHGVSIYFPDRPMSPLYQQLEFADVQKCLWATFVTMVSPKIDAPEPLVVEEVGAWEGIDVVTSNDYGHHHPSRKPASSKSRTKRRVVATKTRTKTHTKTH